MTDFDGALEDAIARYLARRGLMVVTNDADLTTHHKPDCPVMRDPVLSLAHCPGDWTDGCRVKP